MRASFDYPGTTVSRLNGVVPQRESDPDVMGDSPLLIHLVAPALVSWGLRRLIQTAGGKFVLAGCSPILSEALSLMERSLPDVVVIDLDDGYTLADLADLYARLRVKILVLTSSSDPAFFSRVLETGARGFLHKREAPGALLHAIDIVGEGQVFATQSDTERLFMATATVAVQRMADPDAGKIATLTMRERQTIAAVTSDAAAPVKVIASRLCISEHTLRNHLTSIYSKLGVTGRLDLYAFASAHNLTGARTSAR